MTTTANSSPVLNADELREARMSSSRRLTSAPASNDARVGELEREVRRLRKAIAMTHITCSRLHHCASHQHEAWEPCPALAEFNRLTEIKPAKKGSKQP